MTGLIVIDVIEHILVSGVITAIFEVGLHVVRAQSLQIVVLDELYAFLILHNLCVGNEEIPFEFPGEGRPHPYNYPHVVSFVVL